MSVLQECPQCRLRQKTKNKRCKCGADLDKAKRSKKVRYWVAFRLPDGTQRQESLQSIADVDPYSIEDARAVDSKRQYEEDYSIVPLGRFSTKTEGGNVPFDSILPGYYKQYTINTLAKYVRCTEEAIEDDHYNRRGQISGNWN